MIIGIGLDLVDVERISRAMENPRFLQRVLTGAERDYCRTAESVAGRWAAKEAIAKAVGGALGWQEIEIINGPGGAPKVNVLVKGFNDGHRLHVTITHERGHAAAVAIYEKL